MVRTEPVTTTTTSMIPMINHILLPVRGVPPSVVAGVSVLTGDRVGEIIITAGEVAAWVRVAPGLVTSGVAVVAVNVALAGGVVVTARLVFAGAWVVADVVAAGDAVGVAVGVGVTVGWGTGTG
jgi:hypothetical protein